VDENEVPEVVRQVAEDAVEQVRLRLPVVQAVDGLSGISGLLGLAVAGIRAQLSEPMELAAAGIRAQLAEILQPVLPAILAAPWAEFDRSLKTMTDGPLQVYADQIAAARQDGLAQLTAGISLQGARQNVTASASLTPSPPVAAVDRAGEPTGIEPAAKQQETAAEHRLAMNQAAFVITLVWLLALSMLAAQLKLPPEVQDYLNTLWPTIAIALTIHLAINDKRKH
jgi:hypothetical protein